MASSFRFDGVYKWMSTAPGDGLFLALAETTMMLRAICPREYIALGFEAMWRAR